MTKVLLIVYKLFYWDMVYAVSCICGRGKWITEAAGFLEIFRTEQYMACMVELYPVTKINWANWLIINGDSSFWCQYMQRKRGDSGNVWNNWIILPAFQEAHGALKLVQPSPKWIISDRLCSGGSMFLLVFIRPCKLQQTQNVKRWRRLSVDMCGNFLPRASLNTGLWDAAGRGSMSPTLPWSHFWQCGKEWAVQALASWISWAWFARSTEQGLSKP